MPWQHPAPAPIAPFPYWPYTMAIPQFYWDAESAEQRVKYLCMLYDKLMSYTNKAVENVNVDSEAIKELQDAFQKFQESGFNDYYAEQVAQWIAENLQKIIDAMTVSTVYFGLTDDGYFTAIYPISWKTVQFDTIADYSSDYYGCLILLY